MGLWCLCPVGLLSDCSPRVVGDVNVQQRVEIDQHIWCNLQMCAYLAVGCTPYQFILCTFVCTLHFLSALR